MAAEHNILGSEASAEPEKTKKHPGPNAKLIPKCGRATEKSGLCATACCMLSVVVDGDPCADVSCRLNGNVDVDADAGVDVCVAVGVRMSAKVSISSSVVVAGDLGAGLCFGGRFAVDVV